MVDHTKAYRDKTGRKLTAMDKKLVSLVYDYLLAMRGTNVKRQTIYYNILNNFCDEYNINFSDAVNAGKKVLKYNVAAMMNCGI